MMVPNSANSSRCRLAAIVLATLTILAPQVGFTQEPAIDLEQARTYFAEAEQLAEDDGGVLWGVELYGPLLFVHPSTRSVAANFSAAGFSATAGVYTGELPADLNPSNTAIDWAGRRWTMLVWPLPSNRYDRQRLLAHELFHRVQPELGLPMLSPPNQHMATREGRIWTRLEWRALAEALIRTGRERTAALLDALAFRARRHSLFPSAAEEERALELNEGLAEYTGLKLSGLPAEVLPDRAAMALERRERQTNFARAFAYATGPAYGLLLDGSGQSWREGVSATTDLAALTAEAYGIARPRGGDAEMRTSAYDGRRVIEQETRRAERRAERLDSLRARFLAGPVVRVTPGAEFRYAFDPNAAVPVPDVGTVYESARVTDTWGVLTVESGGVLLVQTAAGITEIVVPAPPDTSTPPRSGDGWRLELAPGWRVEAGEQPGDWRVVR
ncbi:MAG: hypothetical protein PVJ43_09225 [Gemmatimonadales bacterium]